MQQAFDTYAQTYDDHFTNSLIGKAQREQVYKWLLKFMTFQAGHVLEVNCGTGEDALWMAKQGANVLATDISTGMVEIAKKKSDNTAIEFKQLDCKHIGSLKLNTYNLIFSNFGGLNCLSKDELKEFETGCSVLQNKNDQLAFVIMSSNCWWEKFYFTLKKNRSTATRRKNRDGVNTVLDGNHFTTYYYSPKEIKELFNLNYNHVSTKPIGFFVPPSYLSGYFKKHKLLFRVLKSLDRIFGNSSFLSNSADHYLIVFKKK